MSDLTEKVAREIEATSNYVISQHHAKALARAAILAVLDGIAEPTEAMIRAVDRSDLRKEIIARHRVMIAALRKEITNV